MTTMVKIIYFKIHKEHPKGNNKPHTKWFLCFCVVIDSLGNKYTRGFLSDYYSLGTRIELVSGLHKGGYYVDVSHKRPL